MVEQELNANLSINIGYGPKHMLLGIYNDMALDKNKKTSKFLTFGARKCILLNWLVDKASSRSLWHRVILEYVSLDYLTCASYNKDVLFYRGRDPFLIYMGLDIASILIRGIV